MQIPPTLQVHFSNPVPSSWFMLSHPLAEFVVEMQKTSLSSFFINCHHKATPLLPHSGRKERFTMIFFYFFYFLIFNFLGGVGVSFVNFSFVI